MGYSEESKAYRLWKLGTRQVIKRRDVRFNEKLSEENIKEYNHLEDPINVLEINSKPTSVKDETEENVMKDENVSDQEKYKNRESSCEDEPIEDTNEMKAIK